MTAVRAARRKKSGQRQSGREGVWRMTMRASQPQSGKPKRTKKDVDDLLNRREQTAHDGREGTPSETTAGGESGRQTALARWRRRRSEFASRAEPQQTTTSASIALCEDPTGDSPAEKRRSLSSACQQLLAHYRLSTAGRRQELQREIHFGAECGPNTEIPPDGVEVPSF